MAYTATPTSQLKLFSYGHFCSAHQIKVRSHCSPSEWPLKVGSCFWGFGYATNSLCNFGQFTYFLCPQIGLSIKRAWKQSSWRFFSIHAKTYSAFFALCLRFPLLPSELISFLRSLLTPALGPASFLHSCTCVLPLFSSVLFSPWGKGRERERKWRHATWLQIQLQCFLIASFSI